MCGLLIADEFMHLWEEQYKDKIDFERLGMWVLCVTGVPCCVGTAQTFTFTYKPWLWVQAGGAVRLRAPFHVGSALCRESKV